MQRIRFFGNFAVSNSRVGSRCCLKAKTNRCLKAKTLFKSEDEIESKASAIIDNRKAKNVISIIDY